MKRILRAVADAAVVTVLIGIGLYIGYRLKVFNYPVNSAKGLVMSISYLMAGLYIALLSFILVIRIVITKIQLRFAVRSDELWEGRTIASHVRHLFGMYYAAHALKDIRELRKYVTPSFYSRYRATCEEIARSGHRRKFYPGKCSVRFVAVHDYDDNDLDCFTVCISHKSRRYIVTKKMKLVKGSCDAIRFRELWTFRRNRNRWLLDDIIEDASIGDLLLVGL